MAVKEVGVIVNGIPIYQQQFRKTRKIRKTRDDVQKHLLRSGWFSALEGAVSLAFEDEASEIRLKNQKIIIKRIQPQIGSVLLIYAIVDTETKSIVLSTIKNVLHKAGIKLERVFDQLNLYSIENQFLNPIFEKLFADLRLTKVERFRKLF